MPTVPLSRRERGALAPAQHKLQAADGGHDEDVARGHRPVPALFGGRRLRPSACYGSTCEIAGSTASSFGGKSRCGATLRTSSRRRLASSWRPTAHITRRVPSTIALGTRSSVPAVSRCFAFRNDEIPLRDAARPGTYPSRDSRATRTSAPLPPGEGRVGTAGVAGRGKSVPEPEHRATDCDDRSVVAQRLLVARRKAASLLEQTEGALDLRFRAM